jgi:S-DNA-T family DNA segregation ATPase FtsK/SpoIIIE
MIKSAEKDTNPGGCIVMKKKAQIALSILLFTAAAALLALLVLNYVRGLEGMPETVLRIHTNLTALFLQSLWALPFYLVLCGVLLLSAGPGSRLFALFPFSLTLFALAVGFLHVNYGNSEAAFNQFVSQYVGLRSASLILLFVFMLEAILFLIWFINRVVKNTGQTGKNYVLGKDHTPGKGEEAIFTGTQYQGPSVGEDDDHHFHDLTLSFPEIPELPKVSKVEVPESADSKRYRQAISEPVQRSKPVQDPKQSVPPVREPEIPKEQKTPPVQKQQKKIFGTLKPVEIHQPQPEKEQTIAFEKGEVPIIPPENQGFSNKPIEVEPDESVEPEQEVAPDDEQTLDAEYQEKPSEEEQEFVPGVSGLEHTSETYRKSLLERIGYQFPSEDLLDTYPGISSEVDRVTKLSGEVLMKTLREFKIDAQLTGIQKGPVVTMYEILPAPGIRVQTITNLADNIALQLAASRVRMVAPIPGKQAVGIEVPNKERSIVSFKEMLASVDSHEHYEIPVVLGKDITGESQVIDLVKTPHLLIAGATGSGKSVSVNSLICSILYRRSPNQVRLMMVDPKIVELKLYNDIPHLLTPVITDSKKAIKALQYCLYEMERRYDLLDNLNARDIKTYNKKISESSLAREKLPYIVLIIDEFADLMSTTGKEIESYLARLAAMARAVGIHLVLATQRPSTNVITGIIKANIPSRIAFMVASNTDSRIILDQAGAEKLLGRGDMLFSSSWDPVLQRIQGSFLSEAEVERIVESVKRHGEPDYLDESYFEDDQEDEDDDFDLESDDGNDPLMEEALKIVYSRNSASASYLQRRLKIGYNRAARLIEEMEDRGIIGPPRGSQPREVLRMTD